MAIFIGVHDMGHEMTEEQAKDAWAKYQEACKKYGAEGWKTYYNAKEGRAFCVTEAKSVDDVNSAHADANLPTKEVIEVQKMK